MRTCLKRYARSPVIDVRLSRVMKSRRSRSSKTGSRSSTSGSRCATAPSQKIRPITAARWSSRFSFRRSRSMRAAIIAWSVSGIRFEEVPPSSSIRVVSSTKSGLPSVFSSSVFRSEVESWRSASSASSSSSLSSGASGSSSVAAARRRPPPQLGRMSSSSGRARQRIISGASLTRSARCSISSSSGSSPQWTSSKTRISGLASASSAAHSRAAQAISCWLRSVSIPSSTPTASASRSATASSPHWARSFEIAS